MRSIPPLSPNGEENVDKQKGETQKGKRKGEGARGDDKEE